MKTSVLFCALFAVTTNAVVLDFEPAEPPPVIEGETIDVQVGLNDTKLVNDAKLFLRLRIAEDYLTRAQLLTDSLNLTSEDNSQNFTMKGIFLGYPVIEFSYCKKVKCDKDDFQPLNETLTMTVIRQPSSTDTIFTVLVFCLIITANIGMGCSVDLKVVKEVLRRPIAPVIGFFCQFLIMPALAFGISSLFDLSTAEKLGLLAIGSSPGGGPSNMWSLVLNGDISLSITMTLISTIASLAMFPLWMFTLGKVIMDEANFTIPFENIIGALFSTLVPCIIGVFIQKKLPRVGKKIQRLTKPVMAVFLLILFSFGLWANWYIFKLFHLTLIGATCLLPYLGFLISGCVAWLFRQPLPRIITICIETGIQNMSVAMFALKLSLPQPMNDLSIVGAVCPSMFTSIPLIIALICYTIYKRCFRNKDDEKDNDNHGTDSRENVGMESPVDEKSLAEFDNIQGGETMDSQDSK